MTLFKRNNGIYYLSFLQDGKQKVISTKAKSKSNALKFLAQFEREQEGRAIYKCTPITLEKFRFEFLKQSEGFKTEKTIKSYKTTFNFLLKYFKSTTNLHQITVQQLQDYFHWRLNKSSIYQIRKDRINISSFYRYAVERNYATDNPIRNIRAFKPPQKQPLYFSKEDFAKWLDACDREDIRNVAIAGVYTGMRLTELVNLRWNEVDFRNRMIILSNQNTITKNKQVRTCPMSIKLMQLMTDLQQHSKSDRVFSFDTSGIAQNYVSKQFKIAVRKAGINEKLHFHSLRHTYASWLVQLNVPIYTVSRLLGHSDLKTSQIYSHLANGNLTQSVDLINF